MAEIHLIPGELRLDLYEMIDEVILRGLCTIFKREWDGLYGDYPMWEITEASSFRGLLRWMERSDKFSVYLSDDLLKALIELNKSPRMKRHIRESVAELIDIHHICFSNIGRERALAECHYITQIYLRIFKDLKIDTTALQNVISRLPILTDKNSIQWIHASVEGNLKKIKVNKSLCLQLPVVSANTIHRPKELAMISKEIGLLSSKKTAETSSVILRGNPCCGKTTLALQFSLDFVSSEMQSGTTCVVWISASTRDTLLDSLIGCVKELGMNKFILSVISQSGFLSHDDKVALLMSLTVDILNMYESWLIVVDDVQDIQSFLTCLPKEGDKVRGHGSILITTTDGNQPSLSNTRTIDIGGMSVDDAMRLLSRAGDVSGERYHSALSLARMLEFQPLALACAAHYVNSTRGNDKLDKWQEFVKKVSEPKGESRESKPALHDAIEVAIHREITKSETMLAFQYIIATSQKNGIRKRDLVQFVKKRMPEVDENALISSLLSSPFVSANDDNSQFSVHPTVYAVLEEVVPTDTTVPDEILARGPRAVEAYSKALKGGKAFVYRGRVMIIGQDRAGKTCLRNSLCGLPFEPEEPSTVGVDAALYGLDVDHVNASDFRRKDMELLSRDMLPFLIAKDLKASEQPEAELVEKPVSSMGGIEKNSSNAVTPINTDEVDDPDQHSQQLRQLEYDREASETEETLNEQGEESTYSLADETEVPDDVVKSIIEFLRNERIEEAIADKEITISIWDFAGQHLYYASHQVFLSPRATYILVYNLAKDLDDQAEPCVRQGIVDYLLDNPNNETNLDSILSWLNSVHTVCQTEVSDEQGTPQVIIVGTHADKPFEDINQMEKKLKIGILGKSYQKHVTKPCFTVNNVKSSNDDGIKKLQQKIREILDGDPNVGKEEPLRWLHFEKAAKSLVSKSTYFLTIEETSKIAKEVCLIDDPNELNTMLDFYHDLGIMIRYGSMVVLDAHWLIEVFKTIITIRDFDDMDPLYTDHWLEMEKTGKLSMQLTDYILEKELKCSPVKDDLLKMMEDFGLIASFNQEGMGACYYVPSHLRSSPSDVFEQTSSCACPLYIYFPGGFIPHGIQTRLVCALISWDKVEDEPTLYRDASEHFLEMSSKTVLTVLCFRSSIKLLLQSQSADSSYIHNIAQEVRKFVEDTLTELKQCTWYRCLTYEICISCPSCEKKSCFRHSRSLCSEEKCLHLLPLTKDRPFICKKSCGEARWPEISGCDIWCPEFVDDFDTGLPSVPPTGSLDLTDNVKRWVVVGISLNTVLIPPVREYLVPFMENHYEKLKTDHNIDTQSYPSQLKNDGTSNLNYRSINNNDTVKGSANYNYKVANYVDLGRLYLQPYMAKFTDYNETCDASAVLTILVSAAVFAPVKIPAKKVKDDIRNKWGHCNIDEWDDSMFNSCFLTMVELVHSLSLPLDDKQRISDELTEWKNQGVQLLMGGNSKSEMKSLLEGVGDLSKNLAALIESEEKRNRADQLLSDVQTAIDKSLKNEQRIESLEIRVSGLELQSSRTKK